MSRGTQEKRTVPTCISITNLKMENHTVASSSTEYISRQLSQEMMKTQNRINLWNMRVLDCLFDQSPSQKLPSTLHNRIFTPLTKPDATFVMHKPSWTETGNTQELLFLSRRGSLGQISHSYSPIS